MAPEVCSLLPGSFKRDDAPQPKTLYIPSSVTSVLKGDFSPLKKQQLQLASGGRTEPLQLQSYLKYPRGSAPLSVHRSPNRLCNSQTR